MTCLACKCSPHRLVGDPAGTAVRVARAPPPRRHAAIPHQPPKGGPEPWARFRLGGHDRRVLYWRLRRGRAAAGHTTRLGGPRWHISDDLGPSRTHLERFRRPSFRLTSAHRSARRSAHRSARRSACHQRARGAPRRLELRSRRLELRSRRFELRSRRTESKRGRRRYERFEFSSGEGGVVRTAPGRKPHGAQVKEFCSRVFSPHRRPRGRVGKFARVWSALWHGFVFV